MGENIGEEEEDVDSFSPRKSHEEHCETGLTTTKREREGSVL